MRTSSGKRANGEDKMYVVKSTSAYVCVYIYIYMPYIINVENQNHHPNAGTRWGGRMSRASVCHAEISGNPNLAYSGIARACWFKPLSSETNDFKIGTFHFLAWRSVL